ncbi:unnamed protein product [Withania somnifera]
MESFIVIMVKYGETLRRFNARVADDKIGLNIDGLRDKIFQLFKFPPDSELKLTYIDEDGDVVTLVDDEDLHDIRRQDLDPLRISVRLNTEKLGRSSGTSSGNADPLRAPLVPPTLLNTNSSVSDRLKSLRESKSRKILKHSADVASKASSTAREIAELSKHLSMTGLSFLKLACPVAEVITGSVKNGEPSQAANAEEFTFNTEGQPKNDTGSTDASKLKFSQPDKNGVQCESLSKSPEPKSSLVDSKKEEGKKFGDCHLVGKALGISHSNASATGPEKRADKESSENQPGVESVGAVGSSLATGVPVLKNITQRQCSPFQIPVKRIHDHSDRTSIFHSGVRCGVHPITGPRFKSKVKEDCDLCSKCFAQMGNDADYIRMDRPCDIFQGCGVKLLKLDSHFTRDVNVLDGTIMAPLTPFTKVWRMRNNGNSVWPQETRLVWIGGDRLSDAISVELQITSLDVAVDHDLDVAVDFTAPELPGRYISYWRMALPSGEKFGQRVWVLIQNVFYEATQDLNLIFPPASNGIAGSETINANADMTMESIIPDLKISNPAMELVEPVVDGNLNKEQECNSCVSPSAAVNLNKKVLRMNKYDLEQAVDDLCGVSEWDPMLQELEDMGFCNKEMIKKLLKKNNGSIKRVVMDLIVGEY